MNNIDSDFLICQLFKRLSYSFNRTLHICLDDNFQFFHVVQFHLVKEIIKRYFCAGIEFFFFLSGLSLVNEFPCKTFIGYRIEYSILTKYILSNNPLFLFLAVIGTPFSFIFASVLFV